MSPQAGWKPILRFLEIRSSIPLGFFSTSQRYNRQNAMIAAAIAFGPTNARKSAYR